MRDIFDDIFKNQPLDPVEAARRSVRVNLRKRFYKQAGVTDSVVTLDGKPVMTPKRRPLRAPNDAVAQAIAAEWEAQRDTIDPSAMPLTRLANAIIDGVADMPEPVRDEIVKYLGTDLIFYRADTPDGLVAKQTEHWDPLLAFARDEMGARFVLAQGVVHQAQPAEAIAAAAVSIPHEPWKLGAVAAVTTITGSALIALALAAGHIDADAAWRAAQVDEDWNLSTWGRDEEAVTRHAAKRMELEAAALVLRQSA